MGSLKIQRQDEKLLIIECLNNQKIEEYSFQNAISFIELQKYLVAQQLNEVIELEINSPSEEESYNEHEESLIELIKYIIKEYNKKVIEYEEFLLLNKGSE